MDAWDFFVPSIGIFIGINILTCCVGLRRMRLLERRVQSLEERPVNASDSANVTVPYTTMPNYIQPQPTYTYYQQQVVSAPPTATPYYPQDPQMVQRY